MLRKKLTAAMAITFAGALSLPAFAGTLDDAAAFYKAKNYAKAQPLFEKAVKENPNSWQAHLYLAHNCVGLRKYVLAKYHYQCCIQLCANPVISGQCQNSIAQLDKAMGAKTNAPAQAAPVSQQAQPTRAQPATIGNAGSGTSVTAKESPSVASRSSDIAWRKDEVMRLAREDVEKTKAEFKEQLEQEKRDSKKLYHHQDGTITADVSDEREEELKKECEAKCKQIMDIANRRAEGIK